MRPAGLETCATVVVSGSARQGLSSAAFVVQRARDRARWVPLRNVCVIRLWAVLLALATGGPAAARGEEPTRGLWLLPRKDAANSARADLPGNMRSAPKEVWRYGGEPKDIGFAAAVTVRGKPACLIQSHSALRLQRPHGSTIWSNPKLGVGSVVEVSDFDEDGEPEALVTLGARGVAMIGLASGQERWRWLVPEGASLASYQVLHSPEGVFLIVFPLATIQGFCLDLGRSRTQPIVVWERSYPNAYWPGFGPLIVLADMDNDGRQEIVLAGKPGYVAALDAATGHIKFDLHYEVAGGDQTGRPYGLLQAVDLDGDGFRDVVMISCQVEEYAAVLHNEAGKGFRLLWSQFVEKDLPDDLRELRPNVTSLADLDGNGRRELVVGAFNLSGDNRWHTLVLDPAKGLRAPLADLPDRYFWGCYDLNDDGRPEIVTSTEKQRKFAASSTLQAVDGRTFRDMASVEGASLFLANGRLPQDTGFMAIRHTLLYLRSSKTEAGIVLSSAAGSKRQTLWHIKHGKSVLSPLQATPLEMAMAVSAGAERIEKRWSDFKQRSEDNGPAASAPLVSRRNGGRELVMALANGTTIGGEPDLSRPGRFKRSWTVPGGNPAIWIGPQGQRVVCTVEGQIVHLMQPTAGAKTKARSVDIRLPHPVYTHPSTRSGATLLPFGADQMLLFVGLQTGVHTMASALYDAGGTLLWMDAKEGPYPRSAAVADLGAQGPATIVVDNHGKHLLYGLDGKSRLIAHGWYLDVPGRSDGAKYALPIVGPFGTNSETRIVMSPGLDALETLNLAGERLARRAFASAYQFDWCGSAVGRIRRSGEWDIAMVTQEGVLHCADVRTGQTRWTLDLGCKATSPINVVSGDLDGDGRDNFLVGLPDGQLVAVDEHNGAGVVLWKVSFDAGVREAILADVDGEGLLEIIVETDDGRVRVLKGGGECRWYRQRSGRCPRRASESASY